MKRARIMAVSVLVLASVACGGQQVLDLGGNVEGGFDGGGNGGDDAAYVLGAPMPCDLGVCTPPDVCCTSAAYPPSVACEPASLCKDVAQQCTSTTCPAGSVCCAVLTTTSGSEEEQDHPYVGQTRCVQGAACPADAQLVCSLPIYGDLGQGTGCPPDLACYGSEYEVATCGPPVSDAGGD